jgi:hypothetical protein
MYVLLVFGGNVIETFKVDDHVWPPYKTLNGSPPIKVLIGIP